MSFRENLRFLFGFEGLVTKRQYMVTGFSLMALKYAVEVAVAYAAAGRFYPLSAFLLPFASYREQFLGQASGPFLMFLILWSLPFMWVGVSMSVRRAADAGLSPIYGTLFLTPVFNYLTMLGLCLADSKPLARIYADEVVEQSRLKIAISAIVVAGILILPGLFLSTSFASIYGTVLFIFLPTIIGATASWIWNREEEKSLKSSMGIAVSSVILAGLFLMLFALEGALCLFMAAPFAFVGAALGAFLGKFFSRFTRPKNATLQAAGFMSAILLALVSETGMPRQVERSAVTEELIHASPEVVWKNVVEFSELPPPNELFFKIGIAYPKRARIEGRGVGATRYCEFSTGPFVEPITEWNEPKKLAFGVTAQPPTMTELSLYTAISPPHLTENFKSIRGQFELIPMGEQGTLLRGTTWYLLKMAPESYWSLWADFILHKIHARVLRHIKNLSEAVD
jgi:uncharacterized membrane protein YhaH (DUF805 family)